MKKLHVLAYIGHLKIGTENLMMANIGRNM